MVRDGIVYGKVICEKTDVESARLFRIVRLNLRIQESEYKNKTNKKIQKSKCNQ